MCYTHICTHKFILLKIYFFFSSRNQVCVQCRENQFLKNEFTCQDCAKGYRPSANLTGCLQIPVKYIQWSETPSLVAISISLIGLVATIFTMVVFIKHNNTPVVKASTKELSYLIMIGMVLANSTTFFLIAKPTKFNCLVILLFLSHY